VPHYGGGVDDQDELAGYVEVWWSAVADLLALLEEVPEAEWSTPTDLPGWDVTACAAHTAHLESRLAGAPEETAEVGEPAHVTGLMGLYTEIGVINRRDAGKAAILAEIREATARRYEQLRTDPPYDGDARPEVIFGGVPWSWRVLLRNRVLDVWMHEQDVRRAVGRPGNLDSPAAHHTAAYLAEGFGYVLAKKVQAPAGTTAVVRIGEAAWAFEVGEDGRGRPLPAAPATPTLTIEADIDGYTRLAGGRSAPESGSVTVTGDAELAERVLARMATTP
jgi:uncharacterized protein (TIGR03083 family)